MSSSRLQAPFMQDVAETFRATQSRLVRRLSESPSAKAATIIEEELRGLYHGLFVIFAEQFATMKCLFKISVK